MHYEGQVNTTEALMYRERGEEQASSKYQIEALRSLLSGYRSNRTPADRESRSGNLASGAYLATLCEADWICVARSHSPPLRTL